MTDVNNNFKRQNSTLVIFVLSLAILMSAIDTNIINIGLPTISKALNASFTNLQWITLSYLLAVTSLIVSIGRISDILGKKDIFISGIIIFTMASFLCGISKSIYVLILFRALQGLGGAILIALPFAIAGDLIDKKKLIQSMAILTSMIPIGFALGPSLGGILISYFGWRSIFYINIPIGIIALIFAFRFPKTSKPEKNEKPDVLGMIVLSFTLISYVLSVTLAENQGFSRNVVLFTIFTMVGIITFIILEKKVPYPLVDLNMFRNTTFSASLVISVLVYTVMTGAVVMFPFYLQKAKVFSTSLSGLLMMAGPTGAAIFTPVSSKVAMKIGNFKCMISGISGMAIGAFLLSTLSVSSSAYKFAILYFLYNGSLAFFQTPNNASIISLAKPEQRGLASGLLNLSRTIGQTTGAAVIGAIFYFFTHTKSIDRTSPANIVNGIHNTFLISAFIMIIAFLVGKTAFSLRYINEENIERVSIG